MQSASSRVLFLFLCLPLWAAAQPAGVVATASVEHSAILLGDRFELTVVVEHGEEYAIALPSTPDVSPFTLLEASPVEAERRDGRVVERARYALSVYRTGEFLVPSLAVAFTAPGGVTGELATPPIAVTVSGVGADREDAELREVVPPVAFGGITGRELLVYGGVLLALALLILWMARRGRSRRPDRPAPEPPRAPAWVIARRRLDAVRDGPMIPRDQRREFATELPDILREYLAARFAIAAAHMTTWEILEACRAHRDIAAHVDLVNAIQRGCDLVKFARYEPPAEEMRETLALAYALVEATEPAAIEARRDAVEAGA